MTALEIQWEYYDRARKFAQDNGFECVGGDEVGEKILSLWERTLAGLESDPMSLANQIDWVAKYRLIDAYMQRHDLKWDSPKVKAMDLQYHDVRPGKSLFARLNMDTLFNEDQIKRAELEPPRDTRAYFRGKCLQLWADQIAAANWDSIVFDLGTDPLRRIPMMDPLRGTADVVDELLKRCKTPAELIDQLGA